MRSRTTITICLLIFTIMLIGGLAVQADDSVSSGQTILYLPQISAPGEAPPPDTTPPPIPPPDTTPPPATRGGVFPLQDPRTTSPAIAIDPAGGVHVAYVVYEPLNQQPPVYYAYCAPRSNCLDPAAWQQLALDQNAEEVQLQLTAGGKPRLLYRTALTSGESHDYYYAACDSRCSEPAGWTSVRVAGTTRFTAEEWDLPHRSFALDRLDRPRFIYVTGGIGDPRKGVFYVSCDADCTHNDPAAPNWHETPISIDALSGQEIFNEPVLAFTSRNQPRVVANILGSRDGIHYLACDQQCDDPAAWERVFLIERGWGPLASWDLELDVEDRPRVAIYIEGFDDGSGDLLLYAWCDTDCLNEAGWTGGPPGLPQHDGHTPDLELDGRGRPRIAYTAAGAAGLGYLWCDTACEAEGARWQAEILEESAALDATFPVPVPPACERTAWVAGYQPVLVLDRQGNPLVGAEAQRLLRCRYEDPGDPGRIETRVINYRHARFVFAPQPGA